MGRGGLEVQMHTTTIVQNTYLHVDDFVPDQGLEEDADEADQAVLHVLVLDVL